VFQLQQWLKATAIFHTPELLFHFWQQFWDKRC